MIIEWNKHIFSPDLDCYPIHPQAAYRPDLSSEAEDPLDAYMKKMDQEGIDRAVLVHPEPYGDDHQLVLNCLAREPERFKGTSLFYPRDPEAPRKLEALVAQEPRIVSTRFHAHRGKEMYLESFADEGVQALWQQALELDLIIELHIGPNYAGQVAEVLQCYPQSTVLIDHLAEPNTGHAAEYAQVLDLAQFDQVYMKLSGLNHFAVDAPLYLSARSFTRRVIESFGSDRMVWGSGTPRIVAAHMEGYAAAEQEKVKGENLAAMLGFA